MSELVLPVLAAVLIATAAAAGSYLLGRRAMSGNIDTSQAETLWDESRVMRGELRGEIVALRAEVVALRADTLQIQAELEVNRVEAARLREHAARCDRQLTALRRKIALLTNEPRP